jgi:hypothetical protein
MDSILQALCCNRTGASNEEKKMDLKPDESKSGVIFCKNGKMYFSKMRERKFFFAATIIMLLLGILIKLGVI